ncbi:MAG: acyltransferase domain-containing protein, partial [Oligoflexia bacterium]|nr:acyltransferase domain-containing protein [Oligoflexia bacterium]
PASKNPDVFWNNLLLGESQFRALPFHRLYNCEDKECDYPAPPYRSGIIDEAVVKSIRGRLGLDKGYNNTQVLTLEAFDQVYSPLKNSIYNLRSGIFFSQITADSNYYLHDDIQQRVEKEILSLPLDNAKKQSIVDKINRLFLQNAGINGGINVDINRRDAIFSSSLVTKIQRYYGLSGEAMIVNAACAGSLTAINLALMKLQKNEIDIAFVGGVNGSLISALFRVFEELKILAPDRCLPFDTESKGVIVSEGAVCFAMQRVSDAIKNRHPILAIIKGVGVSTNGKYSSLFANNPQQLIRTYQQAYANLDSKKIDYLEAHATGTLVGDEVELASIVAFWEENTLYTGSAKTIVGHTQGAAGAVGLLKSLLIIKNRIIPPSPYFKMAAIDHKNIIINKQPLHLDPLKILRLGVSAFGFGGSNYHLVLEEFSQRYEIRKDVLKKHQKHQEHQDFGSEKVVVLANKIFTVEEINKYHFEEYLKISSLSIPYMDVTQIYLLLITELTIRELTKDSRFLNYVNKARVGVIYAGAVGNELIRSAYKGLFVEMLESMLINDDASIVEMLKKMRIDFPAPSIDLGPGVLDSVVAGRICNYYDFTGANYQINLENLENLENIEGDSNKGDVNDLMPAFKVAALELTENQDVIFLVHTRYKQITQVSEILPASLGVYILTTDNFAKENGLNPQYTLSNTLNHTNYRLQKYDGIDFSKVCFVFSGQNSAFPGMFSDLFTNNKKIQDLFGIADHYVKRHYGWTNISNYIVNYQNLSAVDLNMIKNAALFTLQFGISSLLRENTGTPAILIGHSFGIYAALVAANILSFEEVLDIVIYRDQITPPPYSLGEMLVVTSLSAVSAVLDASLYFISNINSPNQAVISVAPDRIMEVIDILKKNRIFYYRLKSVPCPFHSPLMDPLHQKMKDYWEKKIDKGCRWNLPEIPIYSYVHNRCIDRDNFSEKIISELIAEVIRAPINFIDNITQTYSQGIPSFIEISPKPVSSKFFSEILRNQQHTILPLGRYLDDVSIRGNSTNKRVDGKYLLNEENSKVFKKIREIVHKISGHTLENITIHDRYQSDLNVDSIKMADILVNISKEYNINDDEFLFQNFNDIRETIDYVVDWSKRKILDRDGVRYKGRFVRHKLSWKVNDKLELLSARQFRDKVSVISLTENEKL